MKAVIVLLFVFSSVSLAEKGLDPFQEAWVDQTGQAQRTGASLGKSWQGRLAEENANLIREIAVHPYQTTEHQRVMVGKIFGEEIWFDPRIRPTRCLENAIDTQNFAKTPEPSSLSLLFAGGAVLMAVRRRK